jgi:putative cardiolipin synthase
MRPWLRLLLAAAALAVAGCAALPGGVERTASRAIATDRSTTLGRVAAASLAPAGEAVSGFRLLADADDALEARLALIRSAESSLDVQYYLIADDATGRQFLAALADAARRGVRVRVLVDDLYSARGDALFAALASEPRFEVRLFNPLPARTGGFAARVALSAHEFTRINHRMHNKLLIADGSFAVTGGRNIADEYFDRSGTAHFIDVDLLSSGPMVASLAAVYDAFWNSPWSYPAQSLVRSDATGDAAARGAAALQTLRAPAVPDADDARAGATTLASEIASGRVALRMAPARLVADTPARIRENDPTRGDGPVMRAHLELLASAHSSVRIATPYFVPGATGLATLREARERGVRFSVLTNSLATTDEPLVHFGYARYRQGMLQLGVGLHELVPTREAPANSDAQGEDHHGASLGRLHAKLMVVDDRWLSIGSMNMDRRSARSNTESAIVIDDPALAGEVAAFFERDRAEASYGLRLDKSGKRVEWVEPDTGDVLRTEPRPFGSPGLKPRVTSFFVSEELL